VPDKTLLLPEVPLEKERAMSPVENRYMGFDPEGSGADIPITPQETFVNGVYSSVDDATASRLDRLRSEEGITSTCKLGCCYCCRYYILANVAEANTLVQYVKRELSDRQINDLRKRTKQWHEWEDARLGRSPQAGFDHSSDMLNYEHCCPLLVNGACSAYPVRPLVCRTHFVCSDPLFCRAANDPESSEDVPVVLKSVVTATTSFSQAIRRHIENAGMDFSRSIMLLPHWLAIEMDWDFAISS
jgi:Fe-S-cluster containining protein